MAKFEPEYEGDNPNRAWVRNKIREKEVPIDEVAVIKCLPQKHIDRMFEETILRSYFEIEG